jgi:predicted nucleic-acid-binding Zn-ribbon protein
VDYEEIKQNEGKRALAWLDKHWPRARRICPICQNNDWTVDTPIEMRSFNGGNLIVGGPRGGILPAFAVTCTRCGFLHFFSAVQSDVVRMTEYQQLPDFKSDDKRD